jgi:hypothetical protein
MVSSSRIKGDSLGTANLVCQQPDHSCKGSCIDHPILSTAQCLHVSTETGPNPRARRQPRQPRIRHPDERAFSAWADILVSTLSSAPCPEQGLPSCRRRRSERITSIPNWVERYMERLLPIAQVQVCGRKVEWNYNQSLPYTTIVLRRCIVRRSC